MILKVGAKTDISALKTSILGYLESDKAVCIDCIGEKANYIATYAVMRAQSEFPANLKIEITIRPIMLNTPDGERRGIRWEIKNANR